MKKLKDYYQIFSCFFFSLLGYQVKLELLTNSIENIVFYRSFFGTVILLIFFIFNIKESLTKDFNSDNIFLHILRSIFGVLAMYFGYNSLNYLTLSQASTVSFTKVFFSSILAFLIFKEKVSYLVFFLLIIGFIGVILTSEPQNFNNNLGLYMALFSAFCVSGGIISISYLSKHENTKKILLYHSFLSSIIFFFLFNESITFNFSNFQNYLTITITAIIGQYFNTESYKDSSTNKVMILSYSRIIFSTALGFFFMNENLSFSNILGVIIIILTSFLIKKKN
ncbi:MAG: DMT family transporter [Alphaproteobacteria bacterium]